MELCLVQASKSQLSLNKILVLILCLTVVLHIFPLIHVKASSTLQIPAFNPAPCMFDLPAGAIEGKDVQCGYLTVPEQSAHPEGPTIQLAVAIIKSKNPSPRPDPLIIAQGGPGASTIDTYAKLLLTENRLRNNRDIILFDQRGTLYSKPNLMCKEIDQLVLDTIEADLSLEESERLEKEATKACYNRLAEEGINLSAYDSLENANDIESLRHALGYEQINLYGVSYGTLLALHAMRQNPDSFRSVILDGVVPPQTNFLLNAAKTMDRSFTHLFTACREDFNCNRAFPDLETVFFDLVGRLNENPARVPMVDRETGITYDALIDGNTFQSGLFQMLYVEDFIPALPRMIYNAQEGRFDFFSRIMSILIFDRTMSYGMYYTVLCAEDADFTPQDQELDGVRPEIAEVEKREPPFFLEMCKLWNVEPLAPIVDQPVTSNIPTLILSGGFDPITPADYAGEVAATLPNSYQFVFPAGGHGAAFEGTCQDSIILAFLETPTKKPDESCIEEIQAPVFMTPENVIDVPALTRLLNLEGSSGLDALVLALSLFTLLTATLVFPLAWLVKLFQKTESHISTPTPPFIIRIAGWIAALDGPVLFAFLTAWLFVLLQMINANDNRLFFGVSASLRGWFILPILAIIITLAMLVAGILAWIQRYWRIWTRVYYSLLVLSSFACMFVLARWGLLTALIK
jgi:pimeloyl-ACP methyl ester carboxylesterase